MTMTHGRAVILLAATCAVIALPGASYPLAAPDLAQRRIAFGGRDPKLGLLNRKLGPTLATLADRTRGRSPVYRAGAFRSAAGPDLPAPGDVLIDGADAHRLIGPHGRVLVDAVAGASAHDLLADLTRLGLQGGRARGRIVSGRLPLDALEPAATLTSLAFLRPSFGGTRAGSVTSQGDEALRSAQSRSLFGVDGSGITIGILSSSFDCAGTGVAADIASGDLPSDTTVLDDSACPDDDEGRAMAQIAHDVAPGAGILFSTGMTGEAGAVAAIEQLIDAGADLIVDDVRYLAEPMFQDGIIARAADDAVAAGVTFISAAGNRSRLTYEDAFRPSGVPVLFDGNAHDFDPGPGIDVYQSITIPAESTLVLGLQWDSPFFSVGGPPGSPNDVDICLMDEPPSTILECGAALNTGADPVEVLIFFNDGAFGVEFNLVIELFDGPVPGLIKYILFEDGDVAEHATGGGTLYGHTNASGAVSVGASFYYDTPDFGTAPARLEPFSSRGGVPILFDTSGTRLAAPVARVSPAIVGVDGVNNSFFGQDIANPGAQSDTDHYPNFFGTSAAAAHVAAIAALILDRNGALAPADITEALISTADDMDDPETAGFDAGFDVASGFGLCMADAAVGSVPECGNGIIENPEECDDANTINDDSCGNDCLINICGDGVLHPANGEECDDGNTIDDDFCRNDCRLNYCGDGRVTNFSIDLLINGDFETGTFDGWVTTNLGDGSFLIATPGDPTPTAGFATAMNPGGGSSYALTDTIGPGTRALEQSFTIPASADPVILSFEMFVNDQSGVGPIIDPIGLDHTGPPNQHARVDLLHGGSPALDTDSGIVRNLYLGVDPGPNPNPYVTYVFDLTVDIAPGMTYELRFAEVDNQHFLHLGVDNVSLVGFLIEECDDGNNIDGDGCSATCRLETCAAPAEALDLLLADTTRLDWATQIGESYDVLRTDALPIGGGPAETCVASAITDASAVDLTAPDSGSIFYYLVRARNECGQGTYGYASSGVERTSTGCP